MIITVSWFSLIFKQIKQPKYVLYCLFVLVNAFKKSAFIRIPGHNMNLEKIKSNEKFPNLVESYHNG